MIAMTTEGIALLQVQYLHVDGAVGDECEGGGRKEEKSQLDEGKF